MTNLNGDWTYPTMVRFGPGRIRELADACKAVGMARPLIITDPDVAKLPFMATISEVLEDGGLPVAIFSDVKANPTGGNVAAGIEAFRAGAHDGVVAIGGGSAMDAAKVVAFCHSQDFHFWEMTDLTIDPARIHVDRASPMIAVPTTAGTGSEVGRGAVITDEDTHAKRIIVHLQMMPKMVVSDPELTIGLPPHITAGTAMDAFAHALEAYSSNVFHPMSQGIAMEAMRLVREYLPRAVADGTDIEARSNMLAAASMGAVAFQKGLGAIHAVSHPTGAMYDTPHGLTNAVYTPYVLVHNRPAIEDRMGRLAALLGLKDTSFNGFLDMVLDMREQFSIPHTIDQIGVDDQNFDRMADLAVADLTALTNPIPLTREGAMGIFQSAFSGQLVR